MALCLVVMEAVLLYKCNVSMTNMKKSQVYLVQPGHTNLRIRIYFLSVVLSSSLQSLMKGGYGLSIGQCSNLFTGNISTHCLSLWAWWVTGDESWATSWWDVVGGLSSTHVCFLRGAFQGIIEKKNTLQLFHIVWVTWLKKRATSPWLASYNSYNSPLNARVLRVLQPMTLNLDYKTIGL